MNIRLTNITKTFLLFLLLYLIAGKSLAQTEEKESDLKAVFIYNFTKYIGWDSATNNNSFVIGVIGSSPVTAPLSDIAKTNTVGNKKIIIRVYNRPEDIGNCNILFIPQTTTFSLSSILEQTGRGVLTISEKKDFGKMGTALNFIIINSKLKFEANLKAISAAGLNASSQLLKLANIIN